MAFEEQKINEHRREIDDIDSRILESLNRRAQIVGRIRELKSTASLPIFDPQRENEIMTRLSVRNKGPLRDDDLRGIYKRVLHSMRNFE